jgi:hypothetical protein
MPHHAHSIDRWDDATGSNLYKHLAGVTEPAAPLKARMCALFEPLNLAGCEPA